MNKIELLAPVGSYDAFISAINNGADAIYLAGSHFGAREKATFTNEEIEQMIKYAHIREVKVHVTVNTLIYDDEMDDVIKFVDFLYNHDVDAIIVQDLGVITLIHSLYPDLPIHASTQLNTLCYKQAKVLKDLGVTRVILGREASLDTVKEIREKLDMEVEVFGHGALCMGYSGQCLLSSFTMKKSGNRGECMQLCRLPYTLIKNDEVIDTKEKYLLSCKDLLTLDNLDKIIESGAVSLKVEGRVKSATYVGQVIGTYRKYIDEYYLNHKIEVETQDITNLKKVFNREFTKGYMFNEKPRDIVNAYRPNNIGIRIGQVTSINGSKVYIKLNDRLHQGDGIRIVSHEDAGLTLNKIYKNGLLINEAYNGDVISIDLREKVRVNDIVYKTSDFLINKEIEEKNKIVSRRFNIDVTVFAYIGKKLSLSAIDDLGNNVKVESEFIVDKALKSPTTKERIQEQVSKLGESVYKLGNFDFNGDEMIIIPISVINALRNRIIEELDLVRANRNHYKGKQSFAFERIDIPSQDFSFTYKVNNKEQYDCLNGIEKENIYYKGDGCVFSYPRVSLGAIKTNNSSVLLNELSDIDTNKFMIANCYLNTTNAYALYTLYKLGFKRVCVSLEMGLSRIKTLIDNYQKLFQVKPNIEVVVYGKIDLMITKYCPINKYLTNKDINCGKCSNDRFYLKDRKGYKLELIRDYICNQRIINPKALHLIDYIEDLKSIGVSKLRLEFTNESASEVRDIVDGYNKGSIDLIGVTKGYFREEEY